jgi:DNA polymerase I
VIDPLLVRAYLREKKALPAHARATARLHTGAALHLFATGVAERIVKADVASLYPSLMRTHRIGPTRDHLGVLLAVVDRLVEGGSPRRHARAPRPRLARAPHGRGAVGGDEAHRELGLRLPRRTSLTRFADVHAANEVTRRGRETLAMLCRALARAA